MSVIGQSTKIAIVAIVQNFLHEKVYDVLCDNVFKLANICWCKS